MNGTAVEATNRVLREDLRFSRGIERSVKRASDLVVVRLGMDWDGIPAGTPICLPSPADVACALRQVPSGMVQGIEGLMGMLRLESGAEPSRRVVAACLARIAKEVWEGLIAGGNLRDLPPIWRVVAPGTTLARRCGLPDAWLAVLRSRESHLA